MHRLTQACVAFFNHPKTNPKLNGSIIKIVNNYRKEIEEVEQGNLNDFAVVEKGINVSRKHLQKLRVILRNKEFETKQDEITFFKKQKPYIYGKLKFFVKILKTLSTRPLGSIKSQREFLDNEIKNLQSFYQSNVDFVKYYRSNAEHLDEFYFLRGYDNMYLIADTSHFYTDSEFSTSHDNAVAKIIAYDLLLAYYVEELTILRNKGKGSKNNPVKRHFKALNLGWTANKIDLIELIYALQASGAIRGGKAAIKEMAMACEQIFDMDLGNYYRKFLEIRGRKIEPTKFLDRMKASLLKRMEEADD